MREGEALRTRIFFIIKENPGMVRTEIRDRLGLPNNVVTPAIKELIDMDMVLEGAPRLSKTTNRPGKTLYVSDDWAKELDAQNRVFE
jgi:predicted transcriptional regulator